VAEAAKTRDQASKFPMTPPGMKVRAIEYPMKRTIKMRGVSHPQTGQRPTNILRVREGEIHEEHDNTCDSHNWD